jgi:hypothetical protein
LEKKTDSLMWRFLPSASAAGSVPVPVAVANPVLQQESQQLRQAEQEVRERLEALRKSEALRNTALKHMREAIVKAPLFVVNTIQWLNAWVRGVSPQMISTAGDFFVVGVRHIELHIGSEVENKPLTLIVVGTPNAPEGKLWQWNLKSVPDTPQSPTLNVNSLEKRLQKPNRATLRSLYLGITVDVQVPETGTRAAQLVARVLDNASWQAQVNRALRIEQVEFALPWMEGKVLPWPVLEGLRRRGRDPRRLLFASRVDL